MQVSVYPRNGRVIRSPPNPPSIKSPLKKITKILDGVKNIPGNFPNYFRDALVPGQKSLITPSDIPRITNVSSLYVSRIRDVIQMLGLLTRTWKLNTPAMVKELIRLNETILNGARLMRSYFNDNVDTLREYPAMADSFRGVIGVTRSYLTAISRILSSKGSSG